jgi:hypothetical protein
MMSEKPLAVCPICGRNVYVKHDGTLPYHDGHPNLRQLCTASMLTLEAAKKLAAEPR